MSCGIAKRTSRRGDNFGNGEIEGVIAPETAAHAKLTVAANLLGDLVKG
jgi:putative tricarboxylic transport membrane protein